MYVLSLRSRSDELFLLRRSLIGVLREGAQNHSLEPNHHNRQNGYVLNDVSVD